jgi:hypothetical protein
VQPAADLLVVEAASSAISVASIPCGTEQDGDRTSAPRVNKSPATGRTRSTTHTLLLCLTRKAKDRHCMHQAIGP